MEHSRTCQVLDEHTVLVTSMGSTNSRELCTSTYPSTPVPAPVPVTVTAPEARTGGPFPTSRGGAPPKPKP